MPHELRYELGAQAAERERIKSSIFWISSVLSASKIEIIAPFLPAGALSP